MEEFKIRRANLSDAEILARLEELCFPNPWPLEDIRDEISVNPLARYYVAEMGGVVRGYLGVWFIYPEAHITNMGVHPDFRRRGIASKLIETLFAEGNAEEVFGYTLEVRPSNKAALEMYQGLGFEVAGRRAGYYQNDGEDALIMWKFR